MEDNTFIVAADRPSQETNLAAANTTSTIARDSAYNSVGFLGDGSNGVIAQTERLFTARARHALQTEGSGGKEVDDRGQWAYIKLMTSEKQAKEYKEGRTSRAVTNNDLIGDSGILRFMTDSGEDSKTGYDRFLITGVSSEMSEKVQITEVFGDHEVLYYFGRHPLIFNFRGVLVDSPDNNWFCDWMKLYDDFLRGSQTARNYELIKIVLPNMYVIGTITNFSFSQDSSRDVDIPFAFQFVAKVVKPLPATGPMINTNKLKGVDFSAASSFASQASINSYKGQVAELNSVIQNPQSTLRDKANALSTLGTGVGGSYGVQTEGVKGTLNSFQSTIDGWSKSVSNTTKDIQTSAMFQTVTSSLNGIRTNLFSPIYGILSSLTKLVSNVFNSANTLFNSVISPIRNILRDITNISKKAVALVNLVNSSIRTFGRNVESQLRGVEDDYKTAIEALRRAAGAVASAPRTATQSIRGMFNQGIITGNSPFLVTSSKLTFIRPSLSVTGAPMASKAELLLANSNYSSGSANTL